MINWKVRFRHKTFWTSLLPLLILTVQNLARVFGFEIDLGDKTNEIMAAVTPMLSALTLLGIVVDPTTKGIGDSERALSYDKPYERDVNHDGLVNEADIDELLRRLDALDTKVPRV